MPHQISLEVHINGGRTDSIVFMFSGLPDHIEAKELATAYAQSFPAAMNTVGAKEERQDGNPEERVLSSSRESAIVCAGAVAKEYGAIVHFIEPKTHIVIGLPSFPEGGGT